MNKASDTRQLCPPEWSETPNIALIDGLYIAIMDLFLRKNIQAPDIDSQNLYTLHLPIMSNEGSIKGITLLTTSGAAIDGFIKKSFIPITS